MRLYQIEDLSYSYPEREVSALSGVSLSIEEGEFVLLLGPSGSGKSTLARLLAGFIPRFYGGNITGSAQYRGESLFSLSASDLRLEVGMIFQDPERQILSGEVEGEIAFGLENLGIPRAVMKRRVSETVDFLGLAPLLGRATETLSSGELQKVVLGAVLSMMPRVLVLDEPTSQLSPTAARDIFSLLRSLSVDQGQTVVLVEQRFEECFSLADRILYMEHGRLVWQGDVESFLKTGWRERPHFVPVWSRLLGGVVGAEKAKSVRASRAILASLIHASAVDSVQAGEEGICGAGDAAKKEDGGRVLLELRRASYDYPLESGRLEAVRGVDLKLCSGEITALLGDNGAGKTTLLEILSGLKSPTSGERILRLDDEDVLGDVTRSFLDVGYLGQDPNSYLYNDTVEKEIRATLGNLGVDDAEAIEEMLRSFELLEIRNTHPRDLGSGEKQRVALASVLVGRPRVLLLDEPTRGADGLVRERLREWLVDYAKKAQAAILISTQDIQFAADLADRVLILWQGLLIADGSVEEVLSENLFYSTTVNRLFRGIRPKVVREQQAAELLMGCRDVR